MPDSSLFWLKVTPGGSGVYVYIEKSRVWYIGKTIDLTARMQTHHALPRGKLRNIIHKVQGRRLVFYPCGDPFMSFLEAFLIYCFEPPGNIVWPKAPLIDHSLEYYDKAVEAIRELKEICK